MMAVRGRWEVEVGRIFARFHKRSKQAVIHPRKQNQEKKINNPLHMPGALLHLYPQGSATA
jgi:hypothetical protein